MIAKCLGHLDAFVYPKGCSYRSELEKGYLSPGMLFLAFIDISGKCLRIQAPFAAYMCENTRVLLTFSCTCLRPTRKAVLKTMPVFLFCNIRRFRMLKPICKLNWIATNYFIIFEISRAPLATFENVEKLFEQRRVKFESNSDTEKLFKFLKYFLNIFAVIFCL